MKPIYLAATALFVLVANAGAALPGDAAEGKRLHDASCTGCHDTKVYSRKDHVVRSLAQLNEQFDGCAHMAKKEFTAQEKQNIVKYLNEQFYKFP